MDKELKEIIIAAWLHDVGKFAQRADRKELYNKELEGQYCKPQKGGWYGYQHVVYTQGFLEKYRDFLPDGINVNNVIRFAAKHHSPSEYQEWIVAQGDRLSSGSDRCKIMTMEDAENESLQNDNPAKFYEKPLIHILSTLAIQGKEKPNRAYTPLVPLEQDAIISTTDDKISMEYYDNLWKKFEKDFVALKGLCFDDFILALDSLCERYWWCIPSATNSDSDISLYQHSKTTAAFASTLYQFQKSCGKENESALEDLQEKKFLFIKGDISGIQKYIFDLKSNDDSAKLLRSKSFQIAALGDIVAKNIVKQVDVSDANIITSAGGNFMLLLPNTQKVKEFLPQIQLETETYFLKEFAGKLSVIISDGVEANANDIKQENAQNLINEIGHNADLCKQKKMQKALQKNGAVLNDIYEFLQKNGECPKCGIFAAKEEGGECEKCTALTKIGAELVKSSWIKYSAERLKPFDQMLEITKEREDKSFSSITEFVPGFSVVHLPYSAPRNDDGTLLSFAQIAGKSTGNKKLAMFKADVDNLGLVFSSSLGKRMSFSRYADMSHKLHYFFSAYYTHFLNHFSCKMKTDDGSEKDVLYADVIYTVFSGGDDLCVIGAWDAVIQFARDFQKEFVRLTNGNPSLTLSAGIELASASTPVAMLADNAEASLEKSKEKKEKGKTVKNAVTVFGTTVSWSDFAQEIENGVQLQSYLEKGILTTGVVYKMIDFARRAERVKNGDVSELIRSAQPNLHDRVWKSNFKYVAVRNIKNKDALDWFLQFGASQEEMIKFRIAVSYALYTQRKK